MNLCADVPSHVCLTPLSFRPVTSLSNLLRPQIHDLGGHISRATNFRLRFFLPCVHLYSMYVRMGCRP